MINCIIVEIILLNSFKMTKSNPQIVLDSFALTKSFQMGNAVKNSLVPDGFTKSQHFYLKTWREQSAQNGDWGETWNYILPESLNVVSSHFLEVPLPQIAGSYKAVPGLYAIDTIKLISNGSEVYSLDYKLYIREFLSSLTDEESEQFIDCYLGGRQSNGNARTLCCPMMLPNSHYLRRHVRKSFGIFPHKLSQRLEFEITMGTAKDIVAQGEDAPPSITNTAQWVTREVKGDQAGIIRKYSDARGIYSIPIPRFQTIVPFRTVTANTVDSVKASVPTGSCYEFIVEAYPDTHPLDETDRGTCVLPTAYKITCDGEDVRVLDSELRVRQELFSHGFRSNDLFNNFARICFCENASQSDHCFQGALNCGNVSSIQTELQFAVNTRYRIVVKKYSKVRIKTDGVMRSSLE